MSNKKEKKEIFSIMYLLENLVKVTVKIPEDNFEYAIQEIEEKIKSKEFFDASSHGGFTEISGIAISSLNCQKIIAIIYE